MGELVDMDLLDIQPSQFYLSEEKLERVMKWFDPEDLRNFQPLPVKCLNGRIIFTDGHTRAYAAYRAGCNKVPLIWDEDELSWDLYQICVDACLERGVRSAADLGTRILTAEEYAEKWNGWCDEMQQRENDHG